jgi:hypothetical protein
LRLIPGDQLIDELLLVAFRFREYAPQAAFAFLIGRGRRGIGHEILIRLLWRSFVAKNAAQDDIFVIVLRTYP